MNFFQINKNKIIKIGKKGILFLIWEIGFWARMFSQINFKLCKLDPLDSQIKDSSNKILNKITIKQDFL